MSNENPTWISEWNPEEATFWNAKGKFIARRNLIWSIVAEHIGFSVWAIWSIVAALGGRHHLCRYDLGELDILADLSAFVRAMEEPTSFGLGLIAMDMARQARPLAPACCPSFR